MFRDEAGKASQPVEPIVKGVIERVQEQDGNRGTPQLDSHEKVAHPDDSGTQAFTDEKGTTTDTLDFLRRLKARTRSAAWANIEF